MEKLAQDRDSVRLSAVRCLLLVFANFTLWLVFALAVQVVEGGREANYKCGIKRVKRDFVDFLWNETRTMGEMEWKSAARRRLVHFEDEIHDAAEAGVGSFSGQAAWTFSNAMLMAYSFSSTTSFPTVFPSWAPSRVLSCALLLLSAPLFAALVAQTAALVLAAAALLERLNAADSDETRPGGLLGILRKCQKLLSSGNDAASSDVPLCACCCRASSFQSGEGATSLPPALSTLSVLLVSVGLTSALTLVANAAPVAPDDAVFFAFASAATASFGELAPKDSFYFFVFHFWFLLLGMAIFLIYNLAMQRLILQYVNKTVDVLALETADNPKTD